MGLSQILYNAGIRAYRMGIKLAALRVPKAKEWITGRRRQELPTLPNKPTVWFHAASLGEFEQGQPIMAAFMAANPDAQLVVSFFSPSGYTQRKEYPLAAAVLYLPIDTTRKAEEWTLKLKPKLAVFIKYEVWPNLLAACQRHGCKTALVAARFYPQQRYFQWWGNLFRKALRSFDHIVLQEQEQSAPLLNAIGVSQYSFAPDTRVDRVVAVSEATWKHPLLEQLPNQPVIIAGSIWKKDLEVLLQAIRQWPEITWILAPHDLSPSNLSQLENILKEPANYLSNDTHLSQRIVWADTMGMLAKVYRYGKAAYIGGGFGQGIHNILEPTSYGLPIAFGPNHNTFHEAQSLIDKGAATAISDAQAINDWITTTIQQQEQYQKAGQAALSYIQQHRGGTGIISSALQILWDQ